MIAAQVDASQYGNALDDNTRATIQFVKAFRQDHGALYKKMSKNTIPTPKHWSDNNYNVEAKYWFIMAAYKAPDMLVAQGGLSIDAYKRLESVVMHSKAFYGGKKSFSSALVTFYTVLERGTAF